MMKKIIIVLLLSFIPLLPSSGQMVVTDPSHTAASVVGHATSLTEAIEQGLSIVGQLSTLKQVYDQMKAVKETFDKVSKYIYDLQSIIDATSDLVKIIQQTSDIYKQAARSNVFTVDELIELMDYLTLAIQQATRSSNDIIDYVSSGKWRFTDKERYDAVKAAADAVARVRASLDARFNKQNGNIGVRKKIDYMNNNGLFSPMEAYYANKEQEMTLGSELAYALANLFGQSTETDTARSAAKKTTQLYDNLKTLFFVLSGFIMLIGAFKVYRKANLEEDGLGKTIAVWFTSALTVFILGSIVELFLF
ncbi:MAG: DUF4134 domain-containing protein [Bacteroidales bacterium]|jgi:hypothetical protein|nr:DUF4134 domain-containing protein [Bacteroidales bacterium]